MDTFDTYHAFLITSILHFGGSTPLSIKDNLVPTVFRSEQVIFSSSSNITRLLVPSDGSTYFLDDVSDLPSVFFTINDSRLDGGSCIYVLEDLAAYEILEGGRDSTSDYSEDKSVYFGGKDGVYKYDSESLSAKKFGRFHDDIIQIQKANGTDVIYFLTSNNKLFKLEQNGTIRTKIEAVTCALEFVLDTSNNIYFIACVDGLPRIIKTDGNLVTYIASITEDIQEVHLLRPAFIMVECIPFFGDGNLYVLYVNGTSERKDFYLNRRISAYSIDAALYLVAALDGKIYEYNVMEAMLKSMFGFASNWSTDLSKIVMSIIETTKDSIYKDWNSVFDQ
ncbi:uncharacterized protein LOC125073890 [Vanessa atalanta]|uniref:uncharacterized protein LOC125073890 n=1 Tax=Vanessa atalanta TaxID=42275 RepID=UPI001FCDF01A|nr:uncharacterized protein LOC125073890 [Vanessa atalanta]